MKSGTVNTTEEFVLSVCHRSFLSLWCCNNPPAKTNKELCDILVVCDPHVIIVSVKDVQLKDSQNMSRRARWERKAIDKSVNQIYGAQRWLDSASLVRRDGTEWLTLPPNERRIMHRVAVACGGREEVSIKSGDFGNGYVHVMSERDFHDILNELDTITDLVEYLSAKEACHAGGCGIIIEGSELNLLAWYLLHERTLPSGYTAFFVDNTLWGGLKEKPEYQRKNEADKESYWWDSLIEQLSDPNARSLREPDPPLSHLELALRSMARESRFARRILGRAFREFIELARSKSLRSRISVALPSNNIYVFVFFDSSEELSARSAELANRCYLARHRIGDGQIVIGIGISEYVPNKGSISDLVYLDVNGWSDADDERATGMIAELGHFTRATTTERHEDEYPNS